MRITSPALQAQHGFFTRHGGVSEGVFASLNCGYNKDERPRVDENRRRAMATLGLNVDRLRVLKQMHTATVITVNDDQPLPYDLVGDALVTKLPTLALGVVTADCAPILLQDPRAGVIGAAHSGWKGTLESIGAATVAAMEKLGADKKNITAVIGPCIGAESYEVGPEFPAPFLARDTALGQFFKPSPRSGHFMFDLPGCVRHGLEQLGLGQIALSGRDTYSENNDFFSNRRTLHKGEGGFGLQLSAISLI